MSKIVKYISLSLFLSISFLGNSVYGIEMVGKAIGYAYDKKTGELVYIEEHIKPTLTQHQVLYSSPDGNVFATKTLDYTPSTIAPNFEQLNDLNGEYIYVERDENTLNMKYREKTDASEQTESIDITEKRLVADAGFDEFVRENWEALSRGEQQKVDFLVPSRLSIVPFRMQQAECIEGVENALCLSIETSAWWLRLLVDPVFLAYDLEHKYLLRFVGRANISDETGKYQTVDIRYEYQAKHE